MLKLSRNRPKYYKNMAKEISGYNILGLSDMDLWGDLKKQNQAIGYCEKQLHMI
ncbi:MAG: hypothetical protein RSF40_09095 [Oscillospiraceae bacterium]